MAKYLNEEFATSSDAVSEIKIGKERLRARDFPTAETRQFVRRFLDPAKFAHLRDWAGKITYLVVPSTSGANTVPAVFARELKKTYGGEIVERWAYPVNVTRMALKGGMNKLREGPRYTADEPALGRIGQGRRLVLVDDVVTTGASTRALREILAAHGLQVEAVVSLGQSELRKVNQRDIDRIVEKLEDPGSREAVTAVLAGQLKHAANYIERELTNGSAKIRLEVRAYFAAEYQRLRSLGFAHAGAAIGIAGGVEGPEGAQRRPDTAAEIPAGIPAESGRLRGGDDRPQGAARIAETAAETLVAIHDRLKERWAQASAKDRAGLLKESDAAVRELGGPDLTGVPLRVAAKQFVQGLSSREDLLQRTAVHHVATAKRNELNRGKKRTAQSAGHER